jgi:hypothetical protein
MRLSASARMHVVFQEEKETRLKEFIQNDLAARKAAGESMFGASYRLVVRSTDSPAARALLAVADEVAALGIEIRTLFVQHSSAVRSSAGSQGSVTGAWRAISDPRLLEAHEQLVLSDRKVWIGDCMRRDPSRRDAYETYCDGSDSRALWAARSFEHMWSAAAPTNLEGASKVVPADAFIDASLIAVSESFPSAVALRH